MSSLKNICKNLINSFLGIFRMQLIRKHPDMILYEFDNYEEYRETQTRFNKEKIAQVWADKNTLTKVSGRISQEFSNTTSLFGICHGSRNGFEQAFLAEKVGCTVLGTDISDTAEDYPNTVQWDFHDQKNDWLGKCDFIYTNSLDQSWKPQSALETWLQQLNKNGLIFIEHTESHGPQSASKMDPFGVKPAYMPYLLSTWFGHAITIEVIQSKKDNYDIKVWLFVIKKTTA